MFMYYTNIFRGIKMCRKDKEDKKGGWGRGAKGRGEMGPKGQGGRRDQGAEGNLDFG